MQGTVAEAAPVVPISAQLKYNIDAVCEYIVKKVAARAFSAGAGHNSCPARQHVTKAIARPGLEQAGALRFPHSLRMPGRRP